MAVGAYDVLGRFLGFVSELDGNSTVTILSQPSGNSYNTFSHDYQVTSLNLVL